MKFRHFIAAITLLCSVSGLKAQTTLDSLLLDEEIDFSVLAEDSLLLDELESLSIFSLLDSLLTEDYRISQLSFRLGFTSDVINAGRDLGDNQQGLTPGVSYYHKSGFFASALGYWNSQFDPKYNLTVLSLGYLGIQDKLTYSGSYERTLYHESDEVNEVETSDISNPFTNNLAVGLSYDLKFLYTGLDYSLLFGDDVTHRLRWNVTGYWKKKNVLFFDYILFTPDFSLLFGKEDIILTTFSLREQVQQTDNAVIFRELAELGFTRRSFGLLTARERNAVLRSILAPEATVFGLINYGFSFPITFRMGKWSYNMSYNYNIPVELPGEELDLSSSGYLGINLSYYLNL